MSQNTPNVNNNILQTAREDGIISQESLKVVLVTIMPDDSGSIAYSNNAQTLPNSHNDILDAPIASKQRDNIFVHNQYLNGEILYPYCQLEQAVRWKHEIAFERLTL